MKYKTLWDFTDRLNKVRTKWQSESRKIPKILTYWKSRSWRDLRGNFLDKQCQIFTLYYRIWILKSKSESFQFSNKYPSTSGHGGGGTGEGVQVLVVWPCCPGCRVRPWATPQPLLGLSRCTVVGAGEHLQDVYLSDRHTMADMVITFPFFNFIYSQKSNPISVWKK